MNPENKFSNMVKPEHTQSAVTSMRYPRLNRENESLGEGVYYASFSGEEAFLRDHRILKQRILPGVVHLELALQAIRKHKHSAGLLTLKRVTWLHPARADENGLSLKITVLKLGESEYSFRISGEEAGEEVVYCQGQGQFTEQIDQQVTDLAWLAGVCTDEPAPASAVYDNFLKAAVDYGPSHRGISRLRMGFDKHDRAHVLADISLPQCFPGEEVRPVLPPGIVDSALQAAVGLRYLEDASSQAARQVLRIPYSLESLTVFREIPDQCLAWVSQDSDGRLSDARKVNITLLDGSGRICASLAGVGSRIVEGDIGERNKRSLRQQEAASEPAIRRYLPEWREISISAASQHESETGATLIISHEKDGSYAVMPGGNFERLTLNSSFDLNEAIRYFRAKQEFCHIIWILPKDDCREVTSEDLLAAQESGVYLGFRLVKGLIASGYELKPLKLTVHTWQAVSVAGEPHFPAHSSVHGFIGSLAKEYQHWSINLIDLPLQFPCEQLHQFFTMTGDPYGNARVYREGKWFKQELTPLALPEGIPLPGEYRKGGVYLVIGGAGGLGEIWSEHMIQNYQAQLIWLGRRPLNAGIQGKIDRLAQKGPAPFYVRVDARDGITFSDVYKRIKNEFPVIHGLVHSAIVLEPKSIANMDERHFQAGMAAKVDASIQLAQVLAEESLDFILYFSSAQSFYKPSGLSDYSAACTFSDSYAQLLDRVWDCKVKTVNWGSWGIGAGKENPEHMKAKGIGSIQADEGIAAISQLFALPASQMCVVKLKEPIATGGINDEPAQHRAIFIGDSAPFASMWEDDQFTRNIAALPSPVFTESEMNARRIFTALQMDLLWHQLQPLGFVLTEDSWYAEASTLPVYDNWFSETARLFRNAGYRESVGDIQTAKASWERWQSCKQGVFAENHLSNHVGLVEETLCSLPDILTGRVKVTDIMFPNSSMEKMERIYKASRQSEYFNSVVALAVTSAVQDMQRNAPGRKLRILEIGAGTGGTSHFVFKALQQYQEAVEVYLYTDISPAFLNFAEQNYGPLAPYLRYRLFNVEKDLEVQGIELGHYDLVIATNVLHATSNIRNTLRNAKAALKSNGALLLNELSEISLFAHLTFGLTEGWWLSEDTHLRMKGGPVLSEQGWKAALLAEGFCKSCWPDPYGSEVGQQIIIAQSDGLVRQKNNSLPASQGHARNRTGSVESVTDGRHPKVAKRHEIQARPERLSKQMLDSLVRDLVRESICQCLKLDEGLIEDDQPFSEYGVDSIVAVNLVNTINGRCNILMQTTVLFDYPTLDQLVPYITTTFSEVFEPRLQQDLQPEAGLQEETGNRPVYPEPVKSLRSREEAFLARKQRKGMMSTTGLSESAQTVNYADAACLELSGTCYRLQIAGPGDFTDVKLVKTVLPVLEDDQVRVAVRASSLNFGDILCVKGLYPNMPDYPFTPGAEAAGVIVETGSAVKKYEVGQEVIVMDGKGMGGHASVITCHESCLLPKPASLSFTEACSLPVVCITMLDVFSKAAVSRGESVLIQTAAGGTGLIGVQLARHYGLEVIVTAGSERKLDYLRGLGISHCINYLDQDFEQELLKITRGRGVDVVVNTLPGEAMQKGLRCLAPGGRYVEIAMTALKSARSVDLSVLDSNQSFISVDLGKLSQHQPGRLQEYKEQMIELIENKVISPTISRVFPLDRFADACRFLQDRLNIGKVVMEIPPALQYSATRQSTEVPGTMEKIAVVGMSGRFAKADDLEALWSHLANGDDLVTRAERWQLPEKNADGRILCQSGGFLGEIDKFDPLFFNISGIEATFMDPQQRLFLEECWKAIEDAGYAGQHRHNNASGVYVGCAEGTYRNSINADLPAQSLLGNSSSILASRISYFLDFKGPAIAIDTACSSSLVAMHLACQALRTGEIDFALAGGVFLQASPAFHRVFNAAAMLSPSGHCHAFDDSADGFVPGEGVGVVVLKRLQDAVRDGDHIYGVICGSGVNQDGASNGITAPSAKSQENLEREVYDRYRIDPADIQYVEAHGTGTKLGDPIEFQALTKAFRKDTDAKNYCAMGSIKSNIGHAAQAAGVAGIIKILLSLQHKQLPPSIHFVRGNQAINFTDSPFFINTELRPWPARQGKARLAAISSFGISGTNAHMVIEEAPETRESSRQSPAYLLVLSARKKEELQRQARQLLARLEMDAEQEMERVSFTLLTGRKHFNNRLSLIAKSPEEAITVLGKWLESGRSSQVKVSELQGGKQSDPSLEHYGNQCIDACRDAVNAGEYLEKLSVISELYVQGYPLDYGKLFQGKHCSRISLPTYPFTRESYWIDSVDMRSARARVLHPLVHENDSTAYRIRYLSAFSGNEFFIDDHRIHDFRILPAVAYLEMARWAVSSAMESAERMEISNVVWLRPAVFEADATVLSIDVDNGSDQEAEFEIYSGDGEEKRLFSQGHCRLIASDDPPSIDLEELRRHVRTSWLSSEEIYRNFHRMKVLYGPSFRCLKEVWTGLDDAERPQVLARLELAASRSDTGNFGLHPALLDSALQAAIALKPDIRTSDAAKTGSVVPYAMASMRIYENTPTDAYAWVRYGEGGRTVGDSIDVTLFDPEGKVCVEMKGLTSRPFKTATGEAENQLALYTSTWQSDTPAKASVATDVPEITRHRVVLLGAYPVGIEDRLRTINPEIEVESITVGQGDFADQYEDCSRLLFSQLKQVMCNGLLPGTLVQVLVNVAVEGDQTCLAGLSAWLKSAQKENPDLSVQFITIPLVSDPEAITAVIRENLRQLGSREIRYREGEREIRRLMEISFRNNTAAPGQDAPWKAGGVYLLTGGLGGLGLAVAREIAEQSSQCTLILVGRSAISAEIKDLLTKLEATGAELVYRQADVADRESVDELIKSLAESYGKLNGIIHCAGILKDGFIIRKEEQDIKAVSDPKVRGLVNLDQASRDMALDLFVVFSSLSSVLGNKGQGDYAAANAFMDEYMEYRRKLVEQGARHGRSLSINWPLWETGGMQVDTASLAAFRNSGLELLSSEDGLQVLSACLLQKDDVSQVIVFHGSAAGIRKRVDDFTQQSVSASRKRDDSATAELANDMADTALTYFRKLLSLHFKLPLEDVDVDTPMDAYGIDSVMVVDLTNKLEKTFGSLSKTLFFEVQTIRALTHYFIENHGARLLQLLDGKSTRVAAKPLKTPSRIRRSLSGEPAGFSVDHSARADADIAIIGLSGRYPQADNLQQFWRNLVSARDCITEIPTERWDHRSYFDPDKDAAGKSYSKWGGFITGVDEFDPLFFNISPKDASNIDPQERLFLQGVYSAIEDAGYTRESLTGQTGGIDGQRNDIGVFVGVMYEEYPLYAAQAQALGSPASLQGSPSSIANRVSYFCNFHGPSMAVDSMCSSSLLAIHLACDHIRQGQCELAVAGGVNVSIHPNKYLSLSKGRFASSTGQCTSFGAGGDGYVPGEGVGALILKRKSDAIRDGDHIYAVIKGSAINHGGKTNGYTVPSPLAQGEVIEKALHKAGIAPEAVSYIEAHGTGTSLGDPIEISGLCHAFRSNDNIESGKSCIIGSVKSNIGHCESAAGIAGLTKVVLQMQHNQIVPSLHSSVLNPNIEFDKTPFVVNQTLRDWEKPVVDGREYPRIAGVSSFGAGGTNAHVLLEQYTEQAEDEGFVPETPVLFVLSARNRERLQAYAGKVSRHIRSAEAGSGDMALLNLAYTFQVGREAMEERLGLLVDSMEDLGAKLEQFAAGREDVEGLYLGQVKQNKDALSLFAADEDMAGTVAAWIAKGKYGKLLSLWVKGLKVDWRLLYAGVTPRRISAPTYPFARERYWVDVAKRQSGSMPIAKRVSLTQHKHYHHPLLQENTSDFSGQRFTSRFRGDECFLRHSGELNGNAILPAVALLEMVQQAVRYTCDAHFLKQGTVLFNNLRFSHPVQVTPDLEVHVSLNPLDGSEEAESFCGLFATAIPDSIAFEVSSGKAGENHTMQIHMQGLIILDTVQKPPRRDLQDLRRRISRNRLSAEECYRAFREMGLEYGATYRGIVELHSGDDETLAEVCIPETAGEKDAQYLLHPALLDSSLQAAMANQLLDHVAGKAAVLAYSPQFPVSVAKLEWIKSCESRMWVLVRAGGDGVDIELLNAGGEVCARLAGVKFLQGSVSVEEKPVAETRQKTGKQTPLSIHRISFAGVGAGTVSAPGEQTRPTVRLKPCAEYATVFAPATLDKPDGICLPDSQDLDRAESLASGGGSIEALDCGGGVFSIRIDNPRAQNRLSADAVSALKECFEVLRKQETCRIILLSGNDDSFLCGGVGAEASPLLREVLTLAPQCEVPVIAVMKGDATGLGWLCAATCDLMLLSEEASYGLGVALPAAVSPEEDIILTERFGSEIAEKISTHPGLLSGRELRQAGINCPIVVKRDIDTLAWEIAAQLAEMPSEALTLLKGHLAREPGQNIAGGKQNAGKADTGIGELQEYYQPAKGAIQGASPAEEPENIDLGVAVVSLEVYRNGVAVITLCDEEGKNFFADAQVRGLQKAFQFIRESKHLKVVVLTGIGNYFACGGSQQGLIAIQASKIKYSDAPLYELPLSCEIPVIAAMQGHAIGAGWSLGMFCDLQVFSEESLYSTRFMQFGFTPGFGSTLIFPQRFGCDLGREALFTAADYKGTDLRDRGIAMPVVPRREVLGLALDAACRMAGLPRARLEELKQHAAALLRSRLADTVQKELAMHDKTFIGNSEVLRRIQNGFDSAGASGESSLRGDPMVMETASTMRGTDRMSSIVKSLREMLAEELFLQEDAIDDDTPFVDMGIDSISGVTWVRRINRHYGLDIPATVIYSHPTIREVAAHMLQNGEALEVFQAAEEAADAAPVSSAGATTQSAAAPIAGSCYPMLAPFSKKRCKRVEAGEEHRPAQDTDSPAIAVIGISGQFPESNTLDAYWENIVNGRNCVSEIPIERWDLNQYYDQNPKAPGKTYSKWMGLLDDIDCFDPLFFGISPREAEGIDPQQRLFLQNVWHCIEEAGYNPVNLSGSRCGVFVGCAASDYGGSYKQERQNRLSLTNSSPAMLAGRISYLLNLQGPCMSIDTACSSSLVAIATACDSLLLGRSDMAVAGGVCIMNGPAMHIVTSKAGMLSADGRCFTFDQRANGFVPGEGVGVLLLKRLEDAERDQDIIHAVIRGWGVNQDGKTNGVTAPNPESQTRLQKEVFDGFAIDPAGIQLMEAHGTGTKLGDPIEIEGLRKAFQFYTDKKQYCALGSVKSNIGHLLTAAGVASTLKVLLAIRHRTLPPTINFEKLNEHIALDDSPFYVNTETRQWHVPPGHKRRSAVTSLGFSGTNAHLVIEEYIPRETSGSGSAATTITGEPVIFVLSAKTEECLKAYADSLLTFITEGKARNPDLAGFAYTFQVGREAMPMRLGMLVSSIDELKRKLEAFVAGNTQGMQTGRVPRKDKGRTLFAGDAEKDAAVEDCISKRNLGQLLALWMQGLVFDWNRLYGNDRPQRLSLPVYPFARERYRYEEEAAAGEASATSGEVWLHPLLHRNTSTLQKQRFSSVFTGKEGFWVSGTLPEESCLEMVRLAIGHAAGEPGQARPVVQLKEVVQLQPLVMAGEALAVHVALYPQDNGDLGFEIYSGEEARATLHWQGFGELLAASAAAEEDDAVHMQTGSTWAGDNRSLIGPLQLAPVWEVAAHEGDEIFPLPAQRILLVGGGEEARSAVRRDYPGVLCMDIAAGTGIEEIAGLLREQEPVDHLVWCCLEDSAAEDLIPAEDPKQVCLDLFRLVKGLLATGYGERPLGVTVITRQGQALHKGESISPALASVHGLVGSLAKEYLNWKVRLVDIGAADELGEAMAGKLFSLPRDYQGRSWCYRQGQWYRQYLLPVRQASFGHTVYKTGGVYVVIGGAGLIGRAWTAYMIREYGARVIWLGRREKSERIQTALESLGRLGPMPEYIPVDAGDARALAGAYEQIKCSHGAINGVIHSALVYEECGLAGVDEARFLAPYSAKADVCLALAEVFSGEPLDFVLFFSSINGLINNANQGAYAAGCTYKDAFAHQMSRLWACAVKVMNWGYWGRENIEASSVSYSQFEELGIGLISESEAMASLESLLAGPQDQMGLMKLTRPLAVEGLRREQWISLSRPNNRSVISDIQQKFIQAAVTACH